MKTIDAEERSNSSSDSSDPVNFTIGIFLQHLRVRCNQRFLVRLRNVFVDRKKLIGHSIRNIKYSDHNLNSTSDGGIFSRTIGSPSRLPTADDIVHAAPDKCNPCTQDHTQEGNTTDVLLPTKLKVTVS